MTRHEFYGSPSPAEILADAKREFSESTLQHPVLLEFVLARTSELFNQGLSFPRVSVEPTLQQDEENTSVLGIRVKLSGEVTTEDGTELPTIMYSDLDLGSTNRQTGSTEVTNELRSAAQQAESQDLKGAIETWWRGVHALCDRLPDRLGINPMTGTFELADTIAEPSENYPTDE